MAELSDIVELGGAKVWNSPEKPTRTFVKFEGNVTLKHDVTSLALPFQQDINTAEGDVAEFLRMTDGSWRCVGYQSKESKLAPK